MTSNSSRPREIDDAPLAYPGAALDSERAKRPPLIEEDPYKPFPAEPGLPEVPYEPYSKQPPTTEAPYEPYKGI